MASSIRFCGFFSGNREWWWHLRRRKQRKCEHFWVEKNAQNVFRHSSRTPSIIYTTRHSFVNRTVEKCPVSSPLQLWIQKLFWALDESFKKASCLLPHTWYVHDIQIWRVYWMVAVYLGTVLIEALLSDSSNARRAQCILLNLPLRLAVVGCTLQSNQIKSNHIYLFQ